MLRGLAAAAVSSAAAQRARPSNVPPPNALMDASFIAGATYTGGLLGVVVALTQAHIDCPAEAMRSPAMGGCLFAIRGPFREGWYGGLTLGYVGTSIWRGAAHSCAPAPWLLRFVGGTVAGAIPAAITLRNTGPRNAWRGRVLGVTPLLQSVSTAVLIQSCGRAALAPERSDARRAVTGRRARRE